MNGLLPAALLMASPPSQMRRASSVVAELALVLGMIPLCSYVRVERLQGVAFASILPNTKRISLSAWLHAITRLCRPAVHLPCWAMGAEPEDLLVALQADFVRKTPMLCIIRVVPLYQEGSPFRTLALCKGDQGIDSKVVCCRSGGLQHKTTAACTDACVSQTTA